jgi:hypothetical protein
MIKMIKMIKMLTFDQRYDEYPSPVLFPSASSSWMNNTVLKRTAEMSVDEFSKFENGSLVEAVMSKQTQKRCKTGGGNQVLPLGSITVTQCNVRTSPGGSRERARAVPAERCTMPRPSHSPAPGAAWSRGAYFVCVTSWANERHGAQHL